MTKTMTMDNVDFKELIMLMKKHKVNTFRIVDNKKKSEPAFIILTYERYKEILDTVDVKETDGILQDKEFMVSLSKSEKQITAGQGIPWNEAKKRLNR
jgi:hypothetical protein